VLQKSNAAANSELLNTVPVVVGNGHQEDADSCGGGKCSTEHGRTPSNEVSHLPQAHCTGTTCMEGPDSEDINCIPDTQFLQSSPHPHCPPPHVSSPDVEMIPDTPDSASSTGIRKNFQRSYLASTSNLLAARPQKKLSPPRPKKLKGKRQLSKHASLSLKSAEDCTDISINGTASLLTEFSPGILQPAAAAHVPYPSCDVFNKRCATDPLPLSKRCDHKVTPTKTVPSSNPDVIYGTVPGRLFQEALNREKRQHHSSPGKNKENRKLNKSAVEVPKSLDLDSDPMLSEVLAELQVQSPRNESPQNVLVERERNNNVSDNLSSYRNGTADNCVEFSAEDADLEDILGELRKPNGIQHSTVSPNLSDAGNSLPNIVTENLSSLTSCIPVSSSSASISEDKKFNVTAKSSMHQKANDLMPAELILEEWTDNSALNLTNEHIASTLTTVVDRKLVNGVSKSCLPQSIVNDNKVYGEIISEKCEQNARYISVLSFMLQCCRLADNKGIHLSCKSYSNSFQKLVFFWGGDMHQRTWSNSGRNWLVTLKSN